VPKTSADLAYVDSSAVVKPLVTEAETAALRKELARFGFGHRAGITVDGIHLVRPANDLSGSVAWASGPNAQLSALLRPEARARPQR
jgi:hypothetical protein